MMNGPQIDLTKRGGYSALARELGLERETVSAWFREGKRVPAERVLDVERLTGISRHTLRSDLYPVEDARGAA